MNRPGRRGALAVAALAALLVGAGVGAHLLAGSTDRPLDAVPADVDYVGHVDVDADTMAPDSAVADATRAAFRYQSRVVIYDGPPFRSSFAVGASPLDRQAASSVTYFGRANGSEYAARVVRSNWSTTALVGAVESARGVDLAASDDRELFVARNDSVAVAVLGEASHAVGNVTAVRDAARVAAGEAPTVDGPLRAAMGRQRPAHARFAFRFDPGSMPDLPFAGPTVRQVRVLSGGYRVPAGEPDRIAVTVNVTTGSESSARAVEGMLTLGQRFYDRSIEDQNRSATFDREMTRVSFDTTGRRALVVYRTTPEGLRELLAVLPRV